jgi:hypothetical protein
MNELKMREKHKDAKSQRKEANTHFVYVLCGFAPLCLELSSGIGRSKVHASR